MGCGMCEQLNTVKDSNYSVSELKLTCVYFNGARNHGAHSAAAYVAGAGVGASVGAVVGASVVASAFVVGVGAGVGAGAGIAKVCCCEAVDSPFNAAWIASHLPDLHVVCTFVKASALLLVINISENKYINNIALMIEKNKRLYARS